MSKKIVVATKSPFSAQARDAAISILKEEGFEACLLEKYSDVSDLHSALADANGVIVRSDEIGEAELAAAPHLELVIRAGAGYNNIDVDSCTAKSITVMNTPGQNSNAVAELSVAMMVSLSRHLNLADTTTKAGEFIKSKLGGTELLGKKLGIHGFGYIGQLVAGIARGFGMQVFAYDPWVRPSVAKELNTTLVEDLKDLYKDADYISVHIPKTKETEASINYDLLSLMSENGCVVNAARAEVICYDSMKKILTERPNFYYGADVHPGGDKPGEKELAKFGNQVMLTPHIGASTNEANLNAATAAARQSADFFKRGKMDAAVNKEVVPYWMQNYSDLALQVGKLTGSLLSGQAAELGVICYGELEPYTSAFSDYILKGNLGEAGTAVLASDAGEEAKKRGIKIDIERKPDNSRGHGNSITVDYTAESNGNIERISVRGRYSDGMPVISRIEEFKNVDFIPSGIIAIFQYEEKEGMMDLIGEKFTKAKFNKKQGRFIQNQDGDKAIALFQLEKSGSETDIKEIKSITEELQSNTSEIFKAVVCDFR